jgi:type I restriction enzyme S subunit
MSKLEELIVELCPNGVEYFSLKECTEMKRGTSATKSTLVEGDIPVISGGKEPAFYCDSPNRDGETITVAGSGAGAGYVQYWNKPIFVNDAFSIKGNEMLYTRYVYHYLLSIQSEIYATKKGGGVPHVHISSIENFKIPLPPLPVQQEIVRILDNFTELTGELKEELTAELTARKKQYEYYRDELFGRDYDEMLKRAEEKQMQIVSLEQLGSFTRGKRFVRNDIREEGTPCIHYGDLYTHYGVSAEETKYFLDENLSKKMRFAQKGDVVIVQAGENDIDIGIGVAWMGNEEVAVHDACYIFKHNINPKYVSHYLRTSIYHLQIKKYVSVGKICAINAHGLGKALIPVPSLQEQERIVAILDRFDTLVNDITQGLPAEIEARRKQYEYYRDRLLTFKEVRHESI